MATVCITAFVLTFITVLYLWFTKVDRFITREVMPLVARMVAPLNRVEDEVCYLMLSLRKGESPLGSLNPRRLQRALPRLQVCAPFRARSVTA